MYPSEDLILNDFPLDKTLTAVEHITRLLNFWSARLIKRTAEYHEAVARRGERPDDVIQVMNSQGQQSPLTITQIVEKRIAPVREARSYVETLQRMLAAAQEGSSIIETYWSDLAVLSPAEKVEGETI